MADYIENRVNAVEHRVSYLEARQRERDASAYPPYPSRYDFPYSRYDPSRYEYDLLREKLADAGRREEILRREIEQRNIVIRGYCGRVAFPPALVQEAPPAKVPEWKSGTQYQIDDVVKDDGRFWRRLNKSVGYVRPTENRTDWVELVDKPKRKR